ncbi:UNVERIFIED_CONTAM: hypothetical protein FKN15_021016 [Acipenser sinensis]
MELRLLSRMLLQISGLQGQALGRSLTSLIVAHRQLWLSQARVPDADKVALLDAPISPGHTFGPVVEEILQRSHWECEASRQVAALFPPRVSAWGRSNLWQAPQTRNVTRTVPVPTAPLGDLRHRLQDTPAANNWAHLAGRGNAVASPHTSVSVHGQRPKQPPQTAPPQPQQTEQITTSTMSVKTWHGASQRASIPGSGPSCVESHTPRPALAVIKCLPCALASQLCFCQQPVACN